MAWNKSPTSLAVFSLATFSLNLLLTGEQTQAQVPSEQILEHLLEHQIIAGVTFEPPSEESLDRSIGGATRDLGYCPSDSLSSGQPMLPLVPANTQQGFTVSARPTFFVYVPSATATEIFFILKDQSEDYYYQKALAVPESGGIISVQLPADTPALKTGQSYQWAFVMACQVSLRPDSPTATGWVKRVEPNSVGITQVDPDPSLEMAELYGSAGIWFDLVATVAQLRDQQPEEYTAAWEELLNSVGLKAIASQPLIYSENSSEN